MYTKLLLTITVWLQLLSVVGSAEILKNGGFESTNVWEDWTCWKCHLESVTTSFEGARSVSVTNRLEESRGLQQTIPVGAGERYLFSAHVKLLNDAPGQVYQILLAVIEITWHDGHTETFKIAATHFLRTKDGWQHLVGDIYVPSDNKRGAMKTAWIRIEGPDPQVGYLLDSASLTTFPGNPNWKSEADRRIDQLRKSQVTINVEIDQEANLNDYEVEVIQKKHQFGFGSAISAAKFADPQFGGYAAKFYEMFEWAVLGNQLKWPHIEQYRNHSDYSLALRTLDLLHARGIPVRGHNILWSKEKRTPHWLPSLSKSEIWKEAQRHVKEAVQTVKGKVAHWDVYNEIFQAHYFEQVTGDLHISYQMFKEAHQYDPGAKLFLNEQWAVSTGMITEAYRKLAKQMLASKVPLHRLGVQSHFDHEVPPDPTMMKRRLDRLAEVGLPIWITELDFYTDDRNKMADWYETAYRMYFSHPAIEGILLWGFWDQTHWRPNAALVSGHNFELTPAGQRYKQLMAKWTTHVTHKLSAGNKLSFRGFHGNYDVIVRRSGHPVKTQSFVLNKIAANIRVFVQGNAAQITLPTLPPIVTVKAPSRFTVPSEALSTAGPINCMTRWSAPSDVGNDKHTQVECSAGELMTGCGSITVDFSDKRDGEVYKWEGGKLKCLAYNGGGSRTPLYAAARCCKLPGMHCTYPETGFSGTGVDDQIEARCPLGNHVMGCTSHTYYRDMDGAFPSPTGCVAQNDGGLGGVKATAACCSASHLDCQVKYSGRSDPQQTAHASVECQPGYMLMGCSVYSEYGHTAGAYITHPPNSSARCIAVNGAYKITKSHGVRAVATCCRHVS